jgi:hypothetical protein
MNLPNPAIDMKPAEVLMNPTASAIAGYRSPRMNYLFSKKKLQAALFCCGGVVRIQMSWGDFAGTVSHIKINIHHALEMQLIVGHRPVSYLCRLIARSRVRIS